MSFGNFQLQRLGPGQGNDFGRSIARRSRHDLDSTRQIQPVQESSEGFTGKSKTDLTVVTAEGDRVTISLAAQVKYAASSQTGPGGSSQTVTGSTSSQLRVAVEGDLSDAELTDLGTLLSQFARAAGPAGSGAGAQTQSTEGSKPSPASPDASTANPVITGLASLAAFAYSYKETVQAGTFVYTRG